MSWQLDTGTLLGQGCAFSIQVYECPLGSWLGKTLSSYACSRDCVLVRLYLFSHGLGRVSLLGHGLVGFSVEAVIGAGPYLSMPGLRRDDLSKGLD